MGSMEEVTFELGLEGVRRMKMGRSGKKQFQQREHI